MLSSLTPPGAVAFAMLTLALATLNTDRPPRSRLLMARLSFIAMLRLALPLHGPW